MRCYPEGRHRVIKLAALLQRVRFLDATRGSVDTMHEPFFWRGCMVAECALLHGEFLRLFVGIGTLHVCTT